MLELNKIYCMDCIEGMKLLENNSVDLVITSPPYNLGNGHHTGNNKFSPYNDDMPEKDYQEWQIKVLEECYRVLKLNGSVFYNHKNRIKSHEQITPYEWLLKTPFVIKQELVWFNRSQNFDKIRFYPMTERVYWLSVGKTTPFVNNINHHDLFDWQAVGTDSEHKRAFPEKFVSDILRCFPENSIVLDPFAGRGTTSVVCYKLKRPCISFEIDAKYHKLATERLEEVKNQLTLGEAIE